MKNFILFGTVLGQQCQLPQLKRDDIGWLCNEKFCELTCNNGILSKDQVFIRCWCRSEDECRYIRHYTRYEENMEFELDDDSWQNEFQCQSFQRMMLPPLSPFRVEAPVFEGLILENREFLRENFVGQVSIISKRVYTPV